jgi:hypothetical protein
MSPRYRSLICARVTESKNKQHAKSDRSYAAGADDKANTHTSQTDYTLEIHLNNSFLSGKIRRDRLIKQKSPNLSARALAVADNYLVMKTRRTGELGEIECRRGWVSGDIGSRRRVI